MKTTTPGATMALYIIRGNECIRRPIQLLPPCQQLSSCDQLNDGEIVLPNCPPIRWKMDLGADLALVYYKVEHEPAALAAISWLPTRIRERFGPIYAKKPAPPTVRMIEGTGSGQQSSSNRRFSLEHAKSASPCCCTSSISHPLFWAK